MTGRTQLNKKDEAYSNVVFKTVLDVCKLKKGTIANFVVKSIMDRLKDFINFPIECPFKKVSMKRGKSLKKMKFKIYQKVCNLN